MQKFMIKVNYGTEAIKGLLKEGGSARKAVVQKAMEAAGGKLEAFYYALGDVDAYVIAEVPDIVTVTTLSLAVSAAGIKVSIVPLIEVTEVDAACKRTTSYRGPSA